MASTSTDRVRGVNAGKAIKVPCKVASTVNLTLSGEQTIDGVSCTAGDRVLVKDQNEAEENGIYEVATSEWRRTPDWDGENDVTQGTQVNVNQGTVAANTTWNVSTADPISPGTTEVTLSLTALGDVGPIEADVDDLQNRVSILETNTEVPDPDPEPTPDPGSTYFWNVVINDNTTFANVYVYDYTGDAWIIVKDDGTTPTDDSVGATPPTGFTPGAVAATYDMGSYTAGTLYFYQWIEGSGILEKLDVYGVSGIVVTPKDTIAPTTITDFAVTNGTNSLTQISATWTAATDSGTGMGGYNLWIGEPDSPVSLLASDVTSPITDLDVSGRYGPGEVVPLFIEAYDSATPVNTANSNGISHTLGTTVAGGVITFTTDQYEETDTSSPLTVTLQRTGGDIGTVTVDVSTRERFDANNDPLAISDTDFTAISGSTVTFVDSDVSETVDVTLLTTGASTNNMFQIDIDYGSESGCTVGAQDSALCLINSSATASTGFQQSVSSPYYIAVEMENSNRTLNQGIDATAFWYDQSNSRASGGVLTRPNNVDGELGTPTAIDFTAQSNDYNLAFTQTGPHTLSTRVYHSIGVSTETGHAALLRPISTITEAGGTATVTLTENHDYTNGDKVYLEGNTPSAYNAEFTVANATADAFEITVAGGTGAASVVGNAINGTTSIGIHAPSVATSPVDNHSWTDTNASAVLRKINIPAAGTWVLRWYQQDVNFKPDKFCIWLTSETYDPSTVGDPGVFPRDENMGPAESSYLTTTAAVDNPDNPTIPWEPLPPTSLTATTLIPDNGNTGVSTSTPIQIIFEDGATQLDVQTFTMTANGGDVTGSFSVTGPNTAIFVPASANLIENTTYTMDITGTIIDASGTYKSITEGTWAFTTIDQASTLMSINFLYDGLVTEPQELFITDLNAIFSTTGGQIIKSTSLPTCELVPDPTGGSRGNVLKITHPEGTIKDGIQVVEQLSTQQTEIYCSFDMYVQESYIYPKGAKLFAGLSSIRPGQVTTPDPSYYSMRPSVNNQDAFPSRENGAMSSYEYDWDSRFLSLFWTDPDTGGDFILPKGRWFEIKYRLKMNTFDGLGAGQSDGIVQVWVDGRLVQNRSSQKFSTTDDPGGWAWLYLIAKYGGPITDPTWNSPQDQSEYYDNLRIWVP